MAKKRTAVVTPQQAMAMPDFPKILKFVIENWALIVALIDLLKQIKPPKPTS